MSKLLVDFKNIPLSNALTANINDTSKLYDLTVVFDEETKLVSLENNVQSKKIFNDTYVYDSSRSITMLNHFMEAAVSLQQDYNPKNVLEIGSNSGIFVKHFPSDSTVAVEPCENFAELTNRMNIKTYSEFWTREVCEQILSEYGPRDLVFSANTFSHVQDLDECIDCVKDVLTDDGIFVLETPSFLQVMQENAFDQFYHEHQSYFSYISLRNILKKHNMHIFNIEKYKVHGGTYRLFICKDTSYHMNHTDIIMNSNLETAYRVERAHGIDDFDVLKVGVVIMQSNMRKIKNMLIRLREDGKKVVGYGATAKFTNVMNMCGLNNTHVEHVLDTTPLKHYSYIPNTKVQILPYTPEGIKDVDYFYLGAWNYKKEVLLKEKNFRLTGGRFITHIPIVEIIS